MIARILSELRFRIRALVQRNAVEHELDDELRFHIERETEKLVREGIAPAEAARRARAAFGGVSRIKDDTRDQRGVTLIEQTMQDVHYAFRGLRTRKAFAAGVVLTLGLGIGANATMFGIVDRLLFRAPPALRDQSTVHRLYRHTVDQNGPRIDRNFAFATYLDLRKSGQSLTDVAAFQTRRLAVGQGENVHEVSVTVASASFFRFFDARPVLGRFFTEAEDSVPVGSPVVVLGYAFWQSEFSGQNVIGQKLLVDRTPATIIGVAPKDFVGMTDQGVPALYMPITAYAYSMRGARYPGTYSWSWLELIARRADDATIDGAEAELTAGFVNSWRNAYALNKAWGTPDSAKVRGELAPIQIARGPQAGRNSQVAQWVSGVALIVLLIACANVSNLLLSRAVSRRREIAVRLALGVSRGRLTRQLLTEGLVLAMLGGVAGIAIAQWGAAGLRHWFLPPELQAGVLSDARTLIFTALATLGAAVFTGLAPAFYARHTDVAGSLKAGAREGTYQHAKTQTALLVFQVALSAVLLVGAGLFMRSLNNVRDYRLGYDADRVVFAGVNPRGMQPDSGTIRDIENRMLAGVKSLPGVTHAALAASIPFWSNEGRGLWVPGVDSVSRRGRFVFQVGTPDYFATMGTRILRGRAFTDADRAGTPLVAVVSEGMAKAIWPGQEAIGKCIKIDADTVPCTTVVGISEEMHLRSFADAREYSYFIPAAQFAGILDPQLLVRVDGEPRAFVPAIRARLQQEMPGTAYVNVMPLAALVDPNLQSWKFGTTMFAAFGALALVLAGIGLYSMIAYDVAQRTRDLGIRIALGASMSRVVRFVVGRGVVLIALGVVVGGGFALWAAPWAESLMFNQPTRDPIVFAGVACVLLLVGWAAAAGPAFRASRVDPNIALRGD